MLKNVKIAHALLAFVLVFMGLQVLLGGLGYWALNHINDNVQNLYRSGIRQSNAVNVASLSLVAARTDLSRHSTRVAQKQPEENGPLLSARKHIASADKNIAEMEQSLVDADRQAITPYLQAYRRYSDNLKSVDRVLTRGDMQAYLKQGTQKVQDDYMAARDTFIAAAAQALRDQAQQLAQAVALFKLPQPALGRA